MTAFAYAHAEWQRTLNVLGSQALEARGLPTDGTWIADFSTGLATKRTPDEVPDIQPEKDAA